MKKHLITFLCCLTLVSCKIQKSSGEMVYMPEGYSLEQTTEFVKSIISEDFITELNLNFPELSARDKGGFRYQPVYARSSSGEGVESGILVNVYDLDDYAKKEELENFVIGYLKSETRKL
jgi:hypothetical protein